MRKAAPSKKVIGITLGDPAGIGPEIVAAALSSGRLDGRFDYRIIVGMTFSEFGRRIISNGSRGTDHGIGAPMLLFGNAVQSGILGVNPVIPPSPTINDNVAMQYDFRSVYASVLHEWFCVPQADLNQIMLQNFQLLPVIQNTACSTTVDMHELNQKAGGPRMNSS